MTTAGDERIPIVTDLVEEIGERLLPLDAPELPDDAVTVPPAKPRKRDRSRDLRRSHGKVKLLTLDRLDRRTAAAQRALQLVDAIGADLGGSDRLSEGARQLVQRAAVLGVFVESCEVRWLAGEAIELGDYLAAINSQRRCLESIGLERRARDVTPPSVSDYVAHLKDAAA